MNAAENDAAGPPDPSLAGRFEVLEQFEGGEGWSGLVRAVGANTPCVLKVLDAGIVPDEVSLLVSLDHPRVPRVLEVGDAGGGRSYLLREFVPGEPLEIGAAWTTERVADLAMQVLETLAAVHARGVLHLDLKPANVIESRESDDDRWSYTLLDFGLGGRVRAGGFAAAGGTPFYASPEVLLGLGVDARADLFGLGALLFRLLRPGRIRLAGLPHTLLRDGFFAMVGVDPGSLPEPFDHVLPRLVALQPDARYLDAHEALEAIAGRSGRPSLGSLRPDPIAFHGAALERALEGAASDRALSIEGGDAQTRMALALHAATQWPGAGVRAADEAARVAVEHGRRRAPVFSIPPVGEAELARHLVAALDLDSVPARDVASRWIAEGVTTSSAVAARLEGLVEQGSIVPDGPRWIWPDAVAGRIAAAAPTALEPPASPDELRRIAARGRIELALRAYGRCAAAEPQRDRAWRAALVEGLLDNGQPVRALPFAADLPLHRARIQLDRGRLTEARAEVDALVDADVDTLAATEADRDRLLAALELLEGRPARARERLERRIAQEPSPGLRIVLGQVLLALDEREAAESTFAAVVEELDEGAPFLLAASLTGLAEARRHAGDRDGARAAYERARDLLQSLGHVRHCATAATNLGVLAKDDGDFAAAIRHQRRARALYEHVDDRQGVAFATANYGIASLESSDCATARVRLEEALAIFDSLGAAGPRGLILLRLARALAGLGELDAARARLAEAGALPAHVAAEAAELRRSLDAAGDSTPVESPPATA